MKLQEQILNKILTQFLKKSEAVEVLAEVFQVGHNAIYRRLRGETVLTPDELSMVAKRFNISIDAIIHEDTDKVFFSYAPARGKVKSFEDFLGNILDNMKPLLSMPDVRIKYATSEMPFFQYCYFPEIIAFKLYTWGKNTWNFDYLRQTPFQFDLISPAVHEMIQELLQAYLQLPSTELWNLNLLDNTLNQIEYYLESGSIAQPADALLLCDKMLSLLAHLKHMTEQGKKFPVGAKTMEGRKHFLLFHNEMVDTNNTIIVETPRGKAIYSTFGNPNLLKTTDQRVTTYIDEWFDGIMAKSQPISNHAEKARNQYFNRLITKVERKKVRFEE